MFSVAVYNPPIPEESWPTLESSDFSAVISIEIGEDLTIIGSDASWSEPTLTVNFILLAAPVQEDQSPMPSEESFEIIKQVPGDELSFEDLGLGDTYVSFFGEFSITDVGRYVPYMMKFTDEYGREVVVSSDVSIIVQA